MASSKTHEKPPRAFEEDALRALQNIREAFAALLESLPQRVGRAHEVAKVLGIHRKLGWQIAKLVYESDPLAAAQHVPGAASIRRFLDAVAKQKVNAELIDSARAAVESFERLVEVHAGDRESLNLMLTGWGGEAARKADLVQRRAAFSAGSYIWGVQAQTSLSTVFLSPSTTREDFFDLAHIMGFVALRRMRSQVCWPIRYSKHIADDNSELEQPLREPLDDTSAAAGEPPLLRRFCSQPVPKTRRRVFADGSVVDEITPGPIGNTGAIDCFVGEFCRAVMYKYRTEQSWTWALGRVVRAPCEALILDQFIHEDLFGRIQPQLRMYRDLTGAPPASGTSRQEDQMPIFETVRHLGKGLSGIRTPDVHRYVEMATYVFERFGWDPDRFHVYRARVEYPPMPTMVCMEHPLPERPEPARGRDASGTQ